MNSRHPSSRSSSAKRGPVTPMHRGPQAHATPSSSQAIGFQGFPGAFAPPYHAPNAAKSVV